MVTVLTSVQRPYRWSQVIQRLVATKKLFGSCKDSGDCKVMQSEILIVEQSPPN